MSDKAIDIAILAGVAGIILCVVLLLVLKIPDVSADTQDTSSADASQNESVPDLPDESADGQSDTQEVSSEPEPDITAPEFSGLKTLTVEVGDTVSYRSGVKATDDVDGEIDFKVDSSGVDLSKPGEYTVIYSCVDSAGNETVKKRKIIVEPKPVIDHELVQSMVVQLKKTIINDDNMSKPRQVKAIYDWVRNNITYVAADENTPDEAVYRIIKKRSGDCYNYCYLVKMLLDECGVENMVVSRYHEEMTSTHFWLLVDVGTGWYHLDASPHLVSHKYNCFMQTDAQIYAYNATRSDKPWYYSFDESLYPDRATEEFSMEEAERILSEAE